MHTQDINIICLQILPMFILYKFKINECMVTSKLSLSGNQLAELKLP